MSDLEAKYFVRSFLKFIQKQIIERQFSPDIIESLEVASQCLETAYDLPATGASLETVEQQQSTDGTPSAVEQLDESHPLAHVNLFELFYNSCGDVSPERKQEADNVKNEGNCAMREEKFYEALTAYNRAISLDATNPVFYCNRAAAFSRLGDYQKAADDCKMSLRYDPTYSKAYGRLGIAYSKLNKHKEALDAFKHALRLDPDNQDYINNMSVTQQKLDESANQPINATPNIGINLAGVAGANGLQDLNLGNFANVLNNPEIINMAQELMQYPAMQEMATALRNPQNMGSLLETGRQMVSFFRQQNPGEDDEQDNLTGRTNPDGDDNGSSQPQPPM